MSPELLDSVLLRTDFPDLKLKASGKVRDVYDIDDKQLLFVASDRISAFDYVLATGIPHKGRILNQISLFWFDFLADVVPNHLITADVDKYPPEARKYADQLRGRSMLVRRAEIFPVECIVRGYISGSAWKEYKSSGTVSGIKLPAGLRESDAFPEPIFTPSTKATSGHDENISFDQMCDIVGVETASTLRDLTLRIYKKAAAYARERGIIIADTKFEFGTDRDGNLLLADEIFTPDSSRYWPAEDYRVGLVQKSFDKQFVRNWLTGPESGWDRHGSQPPPPLPDDIIDATRDRYIDAYERISGLSVGDWIGA
jgi:phosphoribosylaminoimidazole-succinocarboxamide synthase